MPSIWLVMGYPVDMPSAMPYVDRIFTNAEAANKHSFRMNGYQNGHSGDSRFSFRVTERLLFASAE